MLRKTKSLKITHFFDVIKKEIVCEDDESNVTKVIDESIDIKQEYHYKEELDITWDGGQNDDCGTEQVHCNFSNDFINKSRYPIVLVERLPDDVKNKLFTPNQRKIPDLEKINKYKFLQYYRKFCPKCKRTGSFEKKNPVCNYCDKQWNYECNKCKKQSSRYTTIIDHLKSKCLKEGYYFACFKCNYKSVSKFRVNKHLKSVHSIFHSLNRIEKFKSNNVQKDTAAKLHKCSKCGDEFQKLPPLLRHMQVCGHNEDNNSSNDFATTPNVVKGRCIHYCFKCNKTVKDDNVGCFNLKKCQTCGSKFSFKCKECNEVFHQYNGMNNHLKISHALSEDVLNCHLCDYKTSHVERLTKHVRRKHFVETHECQICGRKCKNRNAFKEHLRQKHIERPDLQCDTCSYQSKSKQNLKRHITDVHSTGNNTECPQCNITLKNKACLKGHLTYCKKRPRHQCNKCSFKTKYPSGLTRHYENVHPSILPKKEQCPQCATECKNKDSLRQHLRYCENNANFFCNYCFRSCKSKPALKAHLIRVHSKDDDVDSANNVSYFYCDNCTYKSKFKGDLVKHVSIHLDDHKQECPKCKKYFSKEYAKKHEKYCGNDGLRCSLCGHRASNKETLRKHIANVHSEGNEIGVVKTCKNKTYLRAHFKRCGTDPHLQCDYCSYKSKYKWAIKKHIELKHFKSKKRRLV